VTALALARHAHQSGLSPWILDDQRGLAFHCRFARAVQLPTEPEAATAAIFHLARGRELIATSDRWVRWLCDHAVGLQASGVQFLHGSAEALRICLNKRMFMLWCKKAGVPTPELVEEGRFPLILRPEETRHDLPQAVLPKAVEIHRAQDWELAVQCYSEVGVRPLATRSLLGERVTAFSVPVVRTRRGMCSFVVRKVRPPPRECAAGSYMETYPDAAVEELARRVIEQLDVLGMAEVEIMRQEQTGRDYVIEVNPRPWAQYSLSVRAGYDFLGFLRGQSSGVPRRPIHACWMDWTSDLYQVLSRRGMIARGEVTWWGYLYTLSQANAFSSFDLGDMRPFWSDVASLFRR
jgi:predicted ATP-grasp superfamily ATP-dependent carboligase